MPQRRVRTQDVRRYAVQIRAVGSAAAQGTGVIVSPRGEILTCHHVVAAVAGDVEPGDVVAEVILPPGSGSDLAFSAVLVATAPEADLALIRISGGPDAGLPAGSVAAIAAAEDCLLHRFVAYGFRTLRDHRGGYATGRILGPVMDEGSVGSSHPPLQLESSQIAGGMSGSPVLDVERNLVIALVTDTWYPDSSTKDRDTAWASDLANVRLLEAGIELATEDLAKEAIGDGPRLPVDPAMAVGDHVGPYLQGAPPPVAHLRGRESLLRQLDEDRADHQTAISSLVGLGGQGKSAILRAWVDRQLDRSSSSLAAYWWSFDSNPDVDAFLQHALLHFLDPQRLSNKDRDALMQEELRAASVARAVRAKPALLILDGVEAVFRPGEPGLLDHHLRTLVRMLAAYGDTVHCVITSRLPLIDLIDIGSHRPHTVGPLGQAHAIGLLRDFGVKGDDELLRPVADRLDRHALSLVLAGSLIAARYDGDPTRFTTLEASAPADGDDLYLRFQRILHDYDRILTEEQQALLQVLGVQRGPVREDILDRIVRAGRSHSHPLSPVASLSRRQYGNLLDSLTQMGLVMRDEEAATLTCHILVKEHFAGKVERLPAPRQRDFYGAIAKAYLRAVSPKTYGALGLSTAIFAGGLALRQFKPQALVAGGRAAIEDKMLGEAVYFIRRMYDKKEAKT